jgi:hypothetical protein
MDKINDGGPAYPTIGDGGWGKDPGMSLRDWFAGQAMAAIITHNPPRRGGDPVDDEDMARARGAYSYADAMLAAREGR